VETIWGARLPQRLCFGHSRSDDPGFPHEMVLCPPHVPDALSNWSRYHWSVEYFEDLRNVNHCEFIVMKQSPDNGKYILENELRTWSDLKRRAAASTPTNGSATPHKTTSSSNPGYSPVVPIRRWGGCANGCNHDKMSWPRRVMRKNTAEFMGQAPLPPIQLDGEKDDHPIASQEADHTPTIREPSPLKASRKPSNKTAPVPAPPLTPASPNDASDDASQSSDGDAQRSGDQTDGAPSVPRTNHSAPRTAAILRHLHPRGPIESISTEGFSDDSDYFPGMQHLHGHHQNSPGKSRIRASSKARQQSKERKAARKMTEKGWMEESGMGTGARADALGDGDELSDEMRALKTTSPTTITEGDEDPPILSEAKKGDMVVEHGEKEGNEDDAMVRDAEAKGPEEVERLKEADRKTLSEVY
jgi:hypothetical protein